MIKKCLFPAAGYGTRFLPATKAVPKEMLPILTKPLLQYAVEEAMAADIRNMAIITGRGKRAIEDHFDNAFELEMQLIGTPKESSLDGINEIVKKSNFSYVRQKKILGLGHAILTGENLIGNEPFALVLADDFCVTNEKGVLSQLIDVYHKYKCSVVAIEEIPMSQTNKYGIIDGNPMIDSNKIFKVKGMVEKPSKNNAPSNMAIIGRYILTPDIFDILKNLKSGKNGEIQITDALDIQAKKGKVVAYKFNGKRFDCGSVEGYVEATNFLARAKGII